MRLDVWLWAVRAYKTRGLAAAAIKNGRVQIGGLPTKTHHQVKPGEVVVLRVETDVTFWTRTLVVVGAPASRVGAKLVAEYALDQTSPEEREKSQLRPSAVVGYRPPGTGRPTKKERRALVDLTE